MLLRAVRAAPEVLAAPRRRVRFAGVGEFVAQLVLVLTVFAGLTAVGLLLAISSLKVADVLGWLSR